MALHFTRRLNVPLDPSSKARSFTAVKKSRKNKFDVLVAFHGNTIAKYSISAKKNQEEDEEEKKEPYSLK